MARETPETEAKDLINHRKHRNAEYTENDGKVNYSTQPFNNMIDKQLKRSYV